MQNAVFLDLASVDRGDLDLSGLKNAADNWQWYESTAPEQTSARLAEAQIVVTNKVAIQRQHLAEAPKLKLIAVAATGTNNIDLAAAQEFGIEVRNVRNYSTDAVAQHVFSLILALRTRLLDYAQLVNNGGWQGSKQFCRLDFPIHEIAGQTLGIVGFGDIGQAVARIAKAFGMSVLVANRPGNSLRADRVELEDLLPQVDVLSLHVPLAENTRNLIGAAQLSLMKKSALLINTARGGIVDEAALLHALNTGGLGGAGIDVLSTEPPADDNPLLSKALPNLIITPHSAWASVQARQRLIDRIAENIRGF